MCHPALHKFLMRLSTRCPRQPSCRACLAADRAGVRNMLLLKRHAAARHAGFFLDLLLAGLIAAPHGLDKAGVSQRGSTSSHPGWLRGVGMLPRGLPAPSRSRLFWMSSSSAGMVFSEILELDDSLFAGVAAYENALTLCDIARVRLPDGAECPSSRTRRTSSPGLLSDRSIFARIPAALTCLVQLGCLLLDAFLVG